MMLVVTLAFVLCNTLTVVINIVEMIDHDAIYVENPTLGYVLNDWCAPGVLARSVPLS